MAVEPRPSDRVTVVGAAAATMGPLNPAGSALADTRG